MALWIVSLRGRDVEW
jgi:hypothetical protein